MRILMLLGVLLGGWAGATIHGPENLKGAKPCFNSQSVQVSSELRADLPTLSNAIYQAVQTKLRAYRVPLSTTPTCISKYDLHVQIDTVKAPSGLLIYSLSIDVFDSLTYPGTVSIWSSGSFGTQTDQGSALLNGFVTKVGNIIDQVAADYAVANP